MQVKSVTTYSTDKKYPDFSYKNSYIEYNSNGDVLEATEWDENGDIESKILTRYDSNNKITEEINYISNDEITEHAKYTRNEDNSIKKIDILYADDSKTTKKYEYNSIENSRTITIYNEDDEFEGSEFYKFDKTGNIIEKTIFNFNKIPEEKIIFTYNETGNILREEKADERDKILLTRSFIYDESENLIEIKTTNENNNIIEKVITKYDDKKRIIEQKIMGSYFIKISYDDENKSKTEERFIAESQLNYIMTTFFNEKDLIIEEHTFSNILKYEYDYFEDNTQ